MENNKKIIGVSAPDDFEVGSDSYSRNLSLRDKITYFICNRFGKAPVSPSKLSDDQINNNEITFYAISEGEVEDFRNAIIGLGLTPMVEVGIIVEDKKEVNISELDIPTEEAESAEEAMAA